MEPTASSSACARILIIEDDEGLASVVKRALAREGHVPEIARTGEEGLRRAQEEPFHLVITDLRLRGVDGLALMQELIGKRPRLPIILMTGFGTADTAITASRLGAFDFLNKPFEIQELVSASARALKRVEESELAASLECGGGSGYEIVGKSRVMQAVFMQIGRVAPSRLSVLLRGETGTGKELAARAIHEHSERSSSPFVAVNCMAIPENLLESELFGHEKGAFTGAASQRQGWFEWAKHGTLFLDEIGDISLNIQGKLLRVLQERTIQRVGGRETIPVDVRIIAATNRDLLTAIAGNLFRADLYYRLSGAVITLPPLRERKEDIPALIGHFLRKHRTESGRSDISVSVGALDLLVQHPWPGNIRQLENVIFQALLLARNYLVTPEIVREVLGQMTPAPKSGEQSMKELVSTLLACAQRSENQNVHADLIERIEKELYEQAYVLTQQNQSEMARWLGVSRMTIQKQLQRFGLLS